MKGDRQHVEVKTPARGHTQSVTQHETDFKVK